MRISGNKKKSSLPILWKMVVFLLIVVAVFILIYYVFPNTGRQDRVMTCNMENVIDLAGKKVFKHGKNHFLHGETQTDITARSGKFSAICNFEQPKGALFELKDFEAGRIIEASVWRKSDSGRGHLVFDCSWGLTEIFPEVVEKEKNWELLTGKIIIPSDIKDGLIQIYPFFDGDKSAVFFDDLTIFQNKSKENFSPPTEISAHNIDFIVESGAMKKLEQKQNEAIAKNHLITGEDDLVEARLKTGDETIDVWIRLKGDLIDHLKEQKWSFRVKAQKGYSWNGLKEFSVHNSLSRYHLDEWVYHQFLKKEDILTTRYDFLTVALNGKMLGVYAHEEHFTKTILDHNERPPGPIFRFNEDGYWANIFDHKDNNIAWFESSNFEPFEKNEILKDKDLNSQFQFAQNQLAGFLSGEKTASEVFDLDQMAKFLVITDLSIASHALNYNNLRFYFNPVNSKIEPIAYDGYTEQGTHYYRVPNSSPRGFNDRFPEKTIRAKYRQWHYQMFNDIELIEKYMYYLEAFSDPDYLKETEMEFHSGISKREKFIRRDYPYYKFKWEYFVRNSPEIRKIIFPMTDLSVKAYLKTRKSGISQIEVESFHPFPIVVTGFENNDGENFLDEPLVLESYNPEVPVRRYELKAQGKVSDIFVKTIGLDSQFIIPVFKWPAMKPSISAEEVEGGDPSELAFITKENGVYRFSTGRHLLNEDLIFPKGHIVSIGPGTEIVLGPNVMLLSYSPIEAAGNETNPIVIRSENILSGGLAVISAKGKSHFDHVLFQDLNMIRKPGKYLDGSVVFYESDLDMRDCVFNSIKGRDALQIIRSNLVLEHCTFEKCFGDGIDMQFSSGFIRNTDFNSIGKDALEISGGYVELHQIRVKEALYSGLSTNKKAKVIISKVNLENCDRGITASEGSDIVAGKVYLKAIGQGFITQQGSPEFGGAKLVVKFLDEVETNKLFTIEQGTEIIFEGKKVNPD